MHSVVLRLKSPAAYFGLEQLQYGAIHTNVRVLSWPCIYNRAIHAESLYVKMESSSDVYTVCFLRHLLDFVLNFSDFYTLNVFILMYDSGTFSIRYFTSGKCSVLTTNLWTTIKY